MPIFKKSKLEANVAEFLKVDDDSGVVADFISHATRYVKASKDSRLLCNVVSVSKSGMTRRMVFKELAKSTHTGHFNLLNFHLLFESLGYTIDADDGAFRVNGCGVDVVFHTHYTTIEKLGSLGFLSKTDTKNLAQNTPHLV